MPTYSTQKIRRWQSDLAPFLHAPPAPRASRSALLVIDMQEYFASIGAPIVDRVRVAVDRCHAAGVTVIFTQHGHQDADEDGGMLAVWWNELIIEGTPDHRLLATIGARPDDIVVEKKRYDAFFATDLERILRDRDIDDLAIAGVMTNLCVETTARSAFVRDFRVRILMDATATAGEEMHLAALTNLAFGFAHIQTTADWLAGFTEKAN